MLDTTDIDLLTGHDIASLALPHGHSAALAEQLGQDTVVIDCSTELPAHRFGYVGEILRLGARRKLAIRAARTARRT